MMLRRTLLQKGVVVQGHSRALAIVRCTATVEPDASPAQRPTTGAERSVSSSATTSRAPYRGLSPRRGFVKARTPVPSADWVGSRGELWQQQQQGQGQPAPQRERLAEANFLEEDADAAVRKARILFTKHLSQARKAVVLRSLGRQGAAGAIKCLLALREAAAAAPVQRDVRFRLYPQESIGGFGTPLMMFVEGVPGRVALPENGSELCTRVIVSGRTEQARLQGRIYFLLSGLTEGRYVRLDTVGTDTLHLALRALAGAREQLGRVGGSVFAIPEMVSEPLRASSFQQQQQQQQQQEAEASSSSSSAADAADLDAAEQHHAAAAAAVAPQAAESQTRVQVLRLYVGRTPSRTDATSGAAGAPAAAAVAPLVAADTVAEAKGSVAAAVAGPDLPTDAQIMVSRSEWETLREALGSMMEQQKLLAELLEQQKGAAAPRPAEGA